MSVMSVLAQIKIWRIQVRNDLCSIIQTSLLDICGFTELCQCYWWFESFKSCYSCKEVEKRAGLNAVKKKMKTKSFQSYALRIHTSPYKYSKFIRKNSVYILKFYHHCQ